MNTRPMSKAEYLQALGLLASVNTFDRVRNHRITISRAPKPKFKIRKRKSR